MDSLERFEIIGDLYYGRYLRLRPGKSDIYRDSNDEENVKQFDEWCKSGMLLDDAIADISRMRSIRKAEEERADEAEAEVERLKVCVRNAYFEGFDDGVSESASYHWGSGAQTASQLWPKSDAYDLIAEEGE